MSKLDKKTILAWARLSPQSCSTWTGTTDPAPHSKLEKRTPDEAYAVMLPTVKQTA